MNEEQKNNLTASIKQDMGHFAKWLFLAVITGAIVGAISSVFAFALEGVTHFRETNSWVFFGLPVAGVIIVFLYSRFGKADGGTNQVFSSIRSQDDVPFAAAPLIFVATALTHLTGGSAGREGAAVQLGGSIANQMGKWIYLDENDRHVIVMCGMSAAFAALFGTPMAAAVFALEVVSVGIMYYEALMPCMLAALVGSNLAAGLGVHQEAFHVVNIPAFTISAAVKMGFVAVGCAVISILFCMLLKKVGSLYGKYLENKYLRIVVASLIVIGVTLILGTSDYMGAGGGLIEHAITHEEASPLAFLIKMVLTAVTMKAGFKGGEIVPSFCIGATFGCVLGQLIGLSPSICAAAGMVAVFCGVTNCPLTSILIAFELFGFEGASFYVLAIAISYATSGYYSLYKTQTIVYSKYKAKFVNEKTR